LRFALRPRAWAPILAFLGLNLAGYLAARAFAAPRPYVVNIDYGLILIAAALVRPLGRPVHLAALFLGLLLSVTIDVCAIASAPLLECLTRLGDYLAFIDLWPWRVLAPWFIAVILLAGAISWMTRAAGPRDVVGLALLIVALAAADVAIRLPPLRSRTNLLSTSTGMLLRGHLAFAPSTDDVIANRFKIEAPDTLMSISMESLGLYQDPSAQERLISESLVRPLAGRYEVAYVTTHGFGGLTLQGEFRELCGLSLKRPSWSSTEMPALRNCLPNALMRRGYATEAFHGNTGRFYGRSRTYPSLGFRTSTFLEDLPGQPRCRPDLFNSVCDAAVLRRAVAAFDKGGRRFVHVVTLDSHEPLSTEGFPQCRNLAPRPRELCMYDLSQRAALLAVAGALKAAKSPPELVSLYGDHGPPLLGGSGAMSPSRVPYIELRRVPASATPQRAR
jgi:hypothetical protein